MEFLSLVPSALSVVQLGFSVSKYVYGSTTSVFYYTRLYGFAAGLVVWGSGSKTAWRMQAQVLRSLNDDDAMRFRTSMQDECNMIAVAVGGQSDRFSCIRLN